MSYCLSSSIHGICLLSLNSERHVAMRVFTTSLDGHEDAATGGAASAIPEYFLYAGISRIIGRVWQIDQGAGPPHRRGRLYVRQEVNGAVEVGGRVEFVACGTLLHEAREGGK
jgi:predicted PhzF superfamily epimerase YddE/YHI9